MIVKISIVNNLLIMFFPGEKIKFKVISETFVETSPATFSVENRELSADAEPKIPYSIAVSIYFFVFNSIQLSITDELGEGGTSSDTEKFR